VKFTRDKFFFFLGTNKVQVERMQVQVERMRSDVTERNGTSQMEHAAAGWIRFIGHACSSGAG